MKREEESERRPRFIPNPVAGLPIVPKAVPQQQFAVPPSPQVQPLAPRSGPSAIRDAATPSFADPVTAASNKYKLWLAAYSVIVLAEARIAIAKAKMAAYDTTALVTASSKVAASLPGLRKVADLAFAQFALMWSVARQIVAQFTGGWTGSVPLGESKANAWVTSPYVRHVPATQETPKMAGGPFAYADVKPPLVEVKSWPEGTGTWRACDWGAVLPWKAIKSKSGKPFYQDGYPLAGVTAETLGQLYPNPPDVVHPYAWEMVTDWDKSQRTSDGMAKLFGEVDKYFTGAWKPTYIWGSTSNPKASVKVQNPVTYWYVWKWIAYYWNNWDRHGKWTGEWMKEAARTNPVQQFRDFYKVTNWKPETSDKAVLWLWDYKFPSPKVFFNMNTLPEAQHTSVATAYSCFAAAFQGLAAVEAQLDDLASTVLTVQGWYNQALAECKVAEADLAAAQAKEQAARLSFEQAKDALPPGSQAAALFEDVAQVLRAAAEIGDFTEIRELLLNAASEMQQHAETVKLDFEALNAMKSSYGADKSMNDALEAMGYAQAKTSGDTRQQSTNLRTLNNDYGQKRTDNGKKIEEVISKHKGDPTPLPVGQAVLDEAQANLDRKVEFDTKTTEIGKKIVETGDAIVKALAQWGSADPAVEALILQVENNSNKAAENGGFERLWTYVPASTTTSSGGVPWFMLLAAGAAFAGAPVVVPAGLIAMQFMGGSDKKA